MLLFVAGLGLFCLMLAVLAAVADWLGEFDRIDSQERNR